VQASLPGASDIPFQVREAGGAVAVVLKADGGVSEAVERLREELQHYTFQVRIEWMSKS